jgi:chorismate synthase
MSTFGQAIPVSFFGESHGPFLGVTIHSLAAGLLIDEQRIKEELTKRRPKSDLSTPRQEQDQYQIISGVFNGYTTGAPLTIVIPNQDTKSKDYDPNMLRPSHADYAASVKFKGFQDYRGGGHFSGRLTALISVLGAISLSILEAKGIRVVSHIKQIEHIQDDSFLVTRLSDERIRLLSTSDFPVLNEEKKEAMQQAIRQAKEEHDSVGGVVETAVLNVPVGIGDPFFDSVESVLSHLLYSVPAVKGVSFGAGFDITSMRGSEANDAIIKEGDAIRTKTNHSGGIQGGLTNGMPIIMQVAIKPTSSIATPQTSVNLSTKEEQTIQIEGRHDPAIVNRAVHVVTAMTAYGILEIITKQEGQSWMR